jgi:hypothetical protein
MHFILSIYGCSKPNPLQILEILPEIFLCAQIKKLIFILRSAVWIHTILLNSFFSLLIILFSSLEIYD